LDWLHLSNILLLPLEVDLPHNQHNKGRYGARMSTCDKVLLSMASGSVAEHYYKGIHSDAA
jgi:hypothetical protein